MRGAHLGRNDTNPRLYRSITNPMSSATRSDLQEDALVIVAKNNRSGGRNNVEPKDGLAACARGRLRRCSGHRRPDVADGLWITQSKASYDIRSR